MHILLAADDKYLNFLPVQIYSTLLANKKSQHINFYVITNPNSSNLDIFNFIRLILDKFANEVGTKSSLNNIVEIDLDCLKSYPVNIDYITPLTYARLLLEKFSIFDNIERLIYLDVDTFVYEDITDLYNYDLQGKPLGVCYDSWINALSEQVNALHGEVENYFNAGVLLIDLNKWRQMNVYERSLEIVNQRGAKGLPFQDQDILNIIFKDNVTYLPIEYNVQATTINRFSLSIKGECELHKYETPDPNSSWCFIRHFNSWIKPWVFAGQKIEESKDFKNWRRMARDLGYSLLDNDTGKNIDFDIQD